MARRANLSRSVIQKIAKRLVKKPDTDTCLAIADAVGLSPISVFRYAKHLPPGNEIPEIADLETLMAKLPAERRKEVVGYVRFLIDFDKRG